MYLLKEEFSTKTNVTNELPETLLSTSTTPIIEKKEEETVVIKHVEPVEVKQVIGKTEVHEH